MKQVAQQEAERARFIVEKVSEIVNVYCFRWTLKNVNQLKQEPVVLKVL